jgi:hypothetical protein
MDAQKLEAMMDAQCALLGLTLSPEQRPGVLRYLQLVVGMAPRVMDFPLSPHDESGNVFVPVSPAEGAPR